MRELGQLSTTYACTQLLSRVQLIETPWTIARQFHSVHRIFQDRILGWVAISYSGRYSLTGIEPMSPAWAGGFFTTMPPGKPYSLSPFRML